MGIFNGINFPKIIQFDTMCVKAAGTILVQAAGLAIGKEGPLLHIGAIVAVLVSHLPFKGFRTLQNDVAKRKLIACGVACGVGSCFGAPIGGALFAYEISKP